MSVFLAAANLLIHRIAGRGERIKSEPALAGILVDPVRGVTAASDGKRLIEVALPKAAQFPKCDVPLANGEAKPFVLPANVAQQVLKALPPGKVAALAATKTGEKRALVVHDGRAATCISFDPISAAFPDYLGKQVFPQISPIAELGVESDVLVKTIEAMAIDRLVGLRVHPDRLVLKVEGKNGCATRAVVAGMKTEPANAAVPVAEPTTKPVPVQPAEPEPEPEPETADEPEMADEPTVPEPAPVRKRAFQVRRFQRAPQPSSTRPNPGQPTLAQSAFHAFLIRSRCDRHVTIEDLRERDVAAKIDELHPQPVINKSFATWRQWKKLFLMLAEEGASGDEVCRVMNDLRDIQHASSVIAARLERGEAA